MDHHTLECGGERESEQEWVQGGKHWKKVIKAINNIFFIIIYTEITPICKGSSSFPYISKQMKQQGREIREKERNSSC